MFVPRLAVLVAVVGLSSTVQAESRNMVSLSGSLEPMKSRFNDQVDRPRLVAILSPT